MRIVVVGGCGYIGSALVPKLVGRGYEVTVYDLMWFGNHLPSEVAVEKRNVMDITEKELSGVDVVIFIAGLSNDPMAEYSPAKNFVDNASCPSYLAYIAKRAGVRRLIHGGSCSVYGYTVNELYDERAPAVSSYPYGISKLQGEFGCLQLRDDKFSVIALRKGTVCGYSPRMRLDLVVNTMFKSAIESGVITVNNPSIWRPILSIRDAVDAYVRSVEAAPEIGGVFNIASGNYTVGEVADYVADGVKDYMGLDARISVKNIQDFRNYKVTWENARNVIGFHPKHTVRDIVKDLADNFDKFKDFSDPRFYNIQTFKALDVATTQVE
ncbi:MAG TPA: SDR family oxidoreductase [Methylocystis sp.]|nr:SDR family oxidoreductase [Methylocystis sp.]